MFLNKRRSPTLVNVCDFNTLYARERNASLNTKNYLSKSPIPPISCQNLRLVVTDGIPSNILILPKTSSTSSPREKKEQKKHPKQVGVDVYRSLARSSSHCSTYSERDMGHDDMMVLPNSFGVVDRLSPLSNTGYFRTNHLPKLPKLRYHSNENPNSTSKIKTLSERIDFLRSTPPEMFHHPTPTCQYYEDEKSEISSYMSKDESRKQLHVYMPAINC